MTQEHHRAAGMRVLYAEDHAVTREAMTSYLKRQNIQVIEAQDGTEAWALFQEQRPDIVITDINMPGMDGLELTKHIRSTAPDTPVIILTAYSELPLLQKFTDLGVTQCVTKPSGVSVVLSALETAALQLNRHSTKKALQ